MLRTNHAHVLCKRYETKRFIVEYTGTFDIDFERYRSVFENVGLVDTTLSERQSLYLTCTEPEDRIVIALHEIDPGELYVLKIPLADIHVASQELSEIGAKKATFHYVEPMDQSIMVTHVHPTSDYLVGQGATPTSSVISVALLAVLVSMVAVKHAAMADPSILQDAAMTLVKL